MNTVIALVYGRPLGLTTRELRWYRKYGFPVEVIEGDTVKRRPLLHRGRKPTARRKARR